MFVEKNLYSRRIKYCLAATIAFGLLLKLLLFNFEYIDFGFYLNVWITNIKENGYLRALKDPFYNYTPTYMYILVLIAKLDLYPLYAIKVVSIAFDYVMAFFVGRIAFMYWKKDIVMWLSFALVPLLPTVVLNGAFMSQCDSIYVSFILGSVYFIFSKKQIMAMLFLGIAFSLKIQTAIIMPFFFVYMLRGHIKWYLFLIVPAIYVLSIIPTWIVGRPLVDLLTIYIGQAGYNESLVSNFPNIYIWVENLLGGNKDIGIFAVLILVLVGGWYLSSPKYVFTLEAWIKLILLSAIVCPFLLPGMLERYMYLGDVFAILYLILNYKNLPVSIGIVFVSFYSYVRTIYIFSFSGDALYPTRMFSFFEFLPWGVVSVLYMLVIGYVAFDLIKTLSNERQQQEFITEL